MGDEAGKVICSRQFIAHLLLFFQRVAIMRFSLTLLLCVKLFFLGAGRASLSFHYRQSFSNTVLQQIDA
jgi:hypothetical protein